MPCDITCAGPLNGEEIFFKETDDHDDGERSGISQEMVLFEEMVLQLNCALISGGPSRLDDGSDRRRSPGISDALIYCLPRKLIN